jgi:beta-carotene hydroxylase
MTTDPAPGPRAEAIRIDRAWVGAATSTARNPTAWLLALVVALAAGSVALHVRGVVPMWAASIGSTIAAYLAFTVAHDAVHGVAHADKAVNGLFGRVASMLLLSPYRAFRAIHLEHHSHTNDPARDPDFGVSRRPRALLPLWCLGIVVEYRRHFYGRPLWHAKGEIAEVIVNEIVLVALLVAGLASPAARPIVIGLWVVPALVAVVVLALAFDFLPHWPYADRGRFLDTRAYPGRVLEALLLAQNYHLVHHLWTTIPWYRYRRAFEAVRPELEGRGCRIEGVLGARRREG